MKKYFISFIFKILMLGIMSSAVYATTLADSLNEFNFDLYRKISSQDSNIISSPYSLSTLLSFCAVGSAGDTRTELLKVLHLKDANNLISELDKINDSWLGSNTTSSIANSLWAAKDFSYKKSFTDMMKKNKYSHFFTVDYKNPELARTTINTWVEYNTQNYIKNLIPPSAINHATRLVLVNAIYFKSKWLYTFKKENTKNQLFTLSNRSTIQVPMMHQTDKFAYGEDNKVQYLELPYTYGIEMIILLPKENQSLQDLITSLNMSTFAALRRNSKEQKVNVTLPKFTFESTFDDLSETLTNMGIINAFGPKANFSNMVDEPFQLSSAIQKAFIQVDEEGTIAAAATALAGIGSAPHTSPIPSFVADHPFLFMIYDLDSKIILFIGQVTRPQ